MKQEPSFAWIALGAAVVVCGGVYLILDKAAPIVVEQPSAKPSKQATAPASTPAAAPVAPGMPSAPVAREPERVGSGVYRCTVRGATVYQDSPCSGGREVELRESGGLQRPRASAGAPAPAVQERVEAATASNGQGATERIRAAECEQLVRAIESIDAQARAGGSIPWQDHLREQRRKLGDRRYELRC